MSLILEALRKSEAERRRGQAPGLFVEQVRVPVRRSAGTPAWAWGLMLLLAVVLLAWGWREFGGRAPASTDIAAGGSSADGSAASTPIASVPPPATGNTQPSGSVDASRDAAARATDAADDPTAATGAEPYGPDATPTLAVGGDERGFAPPGNPDPARGASTPRAPSPRDDATPTRGAQIVATTPRDTTGYTPANTGVAQNTSDTPPATAAAPANASPTAAPSAPPAPIPEDEYLPRLSELTGDERSGLPALKLSMHVYADDPAQRFVIVDGRRLREGDSPAAGIAVEAIRRDGLVLSVNGRRVLLARP